MSNQQDLSDIEMSIEQAEASIKLATAYKRLQKNRDFKLLITDNYFTEHVCRLVAWRGNPQANDATRDAILRDIDGVGSLQRFLTHITDAGEDASGAIQADENTREEILAEGE